MGGAERESKRNHRLSADVSRPAVPQLGRRFHTTLGQSSKPPSRTRTHYKLKAHVKDSRDQFQFVTDLTIRGKEALRAMNIRFAQAPYAEAGAVGPAPDKLH